MVPVTTHEVLGGEFPVSGDGETLWRTNDFEAFLGDVQEQIEIPLQIAEMVVEVRASGVEVAKISPA